jgi:hypothetical protein
MSSNPRQVGKQKNNYLVKNRVTWCCADVWASGQWGVDISCIAVWVETALRNCDKSTLDSILKVEPGVSSFAKPTYLLDRSVSSVVGFACLNYHLIKKKPPRWKMTHGICSWVVGLSCCWSHLLTRTFTPKQLRMRASSIFPDSIFSSNPNHLHTICQWERNNPILNGVTKNMKNQQHEKHCWK